MTAKPTSLTPRERAEKIVNDHRGFTFDRHDLVHDITAAIEEAVAAALASERQQRSIPGAPLTEEDERYVNEKMTEANRWAKMYADGVREGPEGESPYAELVSIAVRLRLKIPTLLADRQFLLSLIRDLGEDDPGKLAQWQSGRDVGLEEAAREVERLALAVASHDDVERQAAAIRALRRPTS